MKNRTALCSAGVLLATALSTFAAPLQRADVPAEALWVAHADCDGLRSTVMGQYLLAEMEKPEAQEKFAAFQAIFNFDPRKQLHGLTLFSTGAKSEDGVLLVYADVDASRLETLAKAARDHQSTTHNQHVIHNWEDEKKPARDGVKPRSYAAISARNMVVLGQKEAVVAQALDVIDRAATSLSATQTFPELGKTGSTLIIEAATRLLDPDSSGECRDAASHQIAPASGRRSRQANYRQTDGGGEGRRQRDEHGFAGAGFDFLLKLQQDKPEASKFANALSLTQEGAVIRINLAMPADDVVAGMKADAARKAAQKTEKQ